MRNVYFVLDIGGTDIKYCVLSANGSMIGSYQKVASQSNRDKDAIICHFVDILENLFEDDMQVMGIGFAFPGPFDYEQGISLMKGLNKYDSLYGIPLEKTLKETINRSWIKGVRFSYLHDIEAFASGYCFQYPEAKRQRIFYLCLGTGAGSAFTENGVVLKDSARVPKQRWIYNASFKESIIDDYISARGLTSLAYQRMHTTIDGKALQLLAESGDKNALLVFDEFGAILLEAIEPFIEAFRPDVLVLGGQISKGFELFGSQLLEYCNERFVRIQLELKTSERTFQGLFYKMKI